MEYLRAGDIISGQEAKAYLRLNGENQLMFYAKKLTATAVKETGDQDLRQTRHPV